MGEWIFFSSCGSEIHASHTVGPAHHAEYDPTIWGGVVLLMMASKHSPSMSSGAQSKRSSIFHD